MIAEFANRLKSLEDPFIVTHIDADGLTSGAILLNTFFRLGKSPGIMGIRQLDSVTIEQIPKDGDVIFTDMGSGQLEMIDFPCHIIDHHAPLRKEPFQLNSHHLGYNHHEASGSSLTFAVARELGENDDLAPIAMVGAIGDMMDRDGMQGLNASAVQIAKKNGYAVEKKGLSFFGRETRALPLFLSFASDPYLPGLSGREEACVTFLKENHIKLKEIRWRTYHDLLPAEKKKLITALHLHAVSVGLSPWQIKRMIRPYFTFPQYARHTEMRDATEFSTLLNACGRHEKPEIGIKLASGDLSVFHEAQNLLKIHRRLLRRGITQLSEEGAKELKKIQYFTSEEIKPTLIGVVIGMALGSRILRPDKVALGISPQKGGLKISARTVKALTRQGVDLAQAMRQASEKFGGEGGGHDIAAGAMIPEEKLNDFLLETDSIIQGQLSTR